MFEEEVSDKLIRVIAHAMVASRMAQAGYQYIVLDDYWVGGRHANNELFPDPVRLRMGPASALVMGKGRPDNALKMYGQWNATEILPGRQLRAVKIVTGQLAVHDCIVYVLKFRT